MEHENPQPEDTKQTTGMGKFCVAAMFSATALVSTYNAGVNYMQGHTGEACGSGAAAVLAALGSLAFARASGSRG